MNLKDADQLSHVRWAFYADPFTWARVGADAQHMGAEPGFNFNSMYGDPAREALLTNGVQLPTNIFENLLTNKDSK